MKTVLIIEKHQFMRLFLINFLSKNYEVYAVDSPEAASTWLAENTPDLILADFSSSRKIQELGVHSSIRTTPMIVLTDQDKSQERIQALQSGAKDCISKPFNPIELQLRVQSHLPQFSFGSTLSSVA
ncbi:response regulator [Algoriphagus kandeliae]|uniref:Response regulator n=1 Tax=Algoriphagus kandeliae TaxID=2562278 RepID=A0A4Y9QSW7_9BACT|nr:response regulator [Algoriphagus kandeliae]TFV95594.1 response regulator [Algoriphagus kandeliae]